MCEKIPYNTRSEASAAAAGISRKNHQGYKTYQCPDAECKQKFHLATVKKKHLRTPDKKEGKYKPSIQDYMKLITHHS